MSFFSSSSCYSFIHRMPCPCAQTFKTFFFQLTFVLHNIKCVASMDYVYIISIIRDICCKSCHNTAIFWASEHELVELWWQICARLIGEQLGLPLPFQIRMCAAKKWQIRRQFGTNRMRCFITHFLFNAFERVRSTMHANLMSMPMCMQTGQRLLYLYIL